MHLTQLSSWKSLGEGQLLGLDLPNFVVITGRNGAGKSHLLEAIAHQKVTFDTDVAGDGSDIRYFPPGQMIPASSSPATGAELREPWAASFNRFAHTRDSLTNFERSEIQPSEAVLEARLRQALVSGRVLTEATIDDICLRTNKKILELGSEDFRAHAPLVSDVVDPFQVSLSDLFLAYQLAYDKNEQARYRQQVRRTGTFLTDTDFVNRYGPKPWDLLDETLKLLGLDYTFTTPPEDTELIPFSAKLVRSDGVEIDLDSLSSGERVLLTLAGSIFMADRAAQIMSLPRLLLLDEPDASLHPALTSKMLMILQDVLVAKLHMKVIMTTHSPSTVALSPDAAVYAMTALPPRLKKTSREAAVSALTVGVPTLSVRIENRRQVFVESVNDQRNYEAIFNVLRTAQDWDRSPEFLAAGKARLPDGCDKVTALVKMLRDAGADTVRGLIDRDLRTKPAGEGVLFNPERHSIENFLFDPLLLGAFLLRDGAVSSDELVGTSSLRAHQLNARHAPAIVSFIDAKLEFDLTSARPTAYVGKFTCQIAAEHFDMQGHELEKLVRRVFQPLDKYRGESLKLEIIKKAAADLPNFIPESVVDTIRRLTL